MLTWGLIQKKDMVSFRLSIYNCFLLGGVQEQSKHLKMILSSDPNYVNNVKNTIMSTSSKKTSNNTS